MPRIVSAVGVVVLRRPRVVLVSSHQRRDVGDHRPVSGTRISIPPHIAYIDDRLAVDPAAQVDLSPAHDRDSSPPRNVSRGCARSTPPRIATPPSVSIHAWSLASPPANPLVDDHRADEDEEQRPEIPQVTVDHPRLCNRNHPPTSRKNTPPIGLSACAICHSFARPTGSWPSATSASTLRVCQSEVVEREQDADRVDDQAEDRCGVDHRPAVVHHRSDVGGSPKRGSISSSPSRGRRGARPARLFGRTHFRPCSCRPRR